MVRSRLTRSLTARFTAVGITCGSALDQRLSSENFPRLIVDQSVEPPLANPASQLGQAALEPFARARGRMQIGRRQRIEPFLQKLSGKRLRSSPIAANQSADVQLQQRSGGD